MPEQKIRQANFARGADQQVERRQPGSVEFRRNGFRRDRALGGSLGGGPGDLVLRAIIERYHQRHAGVHRGARQRTIDQRHHVLRENAIVANNLQPDIVGAKLVEIADDETLEQPHQRCHLVLGTTPVLGGKGIES